MDEENRLNKLRADFDRVSKQQRKTASSSEQLQLQYAVKMLHQAELLLQNGLMQEARIATKQAAALFEAYKDSPLNKHSSRLGLAKSFLISTETAIRLNVVPEEVRPMLASAEMHLKYLANLGGYRSNDVEALFERLHSLVDMVLLLEKSAQATQAITLIQSDITKNIFSIPGYSIPPQIIPALTSDADAEVHFDGNQKTSIQSTNFTTKYVTEQARIRLNNTVSADAAAMHGATIILNQLAGLGGHRGNDSEAMIRGLYQLPLDSASAINKTKQTMPPKAGIYDETSEYTLYLPESPKNTPQTQIDAITHSTKQLRGATVNFRNPYTPYYSQEIAHLLKESTNQRSAIQPPPVDDSLDPQWGDTNLELRQIVSEIAARVVRAGTLAMRVIHPEHFDSWLASTLDAEIALKIEERVKQTPESQTSEDIVADAMERGRELQRSVWTSMLHAFAFPEAERASLEQKRNAGTILGLPSPDKPSEYAYPTWQFAIDEKLLSELLRCLGTLPPWSKWHFFVTGSPLLQERTPLEVLGLREYFSPQAASDDRPSTITEDIFVLLIKSATDYAEGQE